VPASPRAASGNDTDPSPEVVPVSVTRSEPADAPGRADGATTHEVRDADLGTDDREPQLHAERAGDGPARPVDPVGGLC